MTLIPLIIDGRECPAADGSSFERRDPVTGEVASRAAAAKPADVRTAVAAAEAAFRSWSETGPGERRRLLLRAADLLEAREEEFAAAMLTETGATRMWAGFNVHLAAGVLREAAALTTQITGDVIPSDKPGILSLAVRRAAGVVLGIAPWNAPVILAVRAIATPLACGNTVILRSSELCPATHHLVGHILNEAGFPPGVVTVLSNAPADAPAVVEALIAHPAVRRVNFTGSTGVGRIIARLAAEHLKPALLELGGKAPLIVLDDADLDQAVDAAIFGAFMNQGQICMSTDRFIVDEAVADGFVAKLAERAGGLSAGDPRGPVLLGSLIDPAAADRMETLITDAVGKGAQLAVGGRRSGSVVTPTILDHVRPGMLVYGEESFGPVKPVIRAKDTEDAIRIANDTPYGLSAAVFSRNTQRAMAVAQRLDTGICHINGPTVADEPQMPFGGVKASGYGRFGGKAAIDAFTELRWITIEGPQPYPF
ncbi:salicylaldehyde dehydrogenase [Azospirillum sp. TSH100]|uniref:aldehyde dehydrogenase n=1 Tax=Azospirillum sp. TSH100 TaxID=652764 RepID=UPI000D613E2B|nr:aldehyde dehydrogenase [Azospirillum sp. TSH100]PWC80670.1 salicylaldehyde dehydrogenase [Azospirillum sp. TSH100]QCG90108.1 aldehyde dehydrogenase [Azospirillum sp. TSH100]